MALICAMLAKHTPKRLASSSHSLVIEKIIRLHYGKWQAEILMAACNRCQANVAYTDYDMQL